MSHFSPNQYFQVDIVSRPFWEMSQSIEIYSYNLLLALNKLKKESKLNVNLNLVETGYSLKRIIPPYGNIMSPIVYDLLAPITSQAKIRQNPSIVHIVHHLLSPYAFGLNEIPIIVTIHHIPEYLDPEYYKIEREWFEVLFCNELDKYISKYQNIELAKSILIDRKKMNVKDTLYSMHDIVSFKIAIQKASAYLAVSSLTALELKSFFPNYVSKRKIFVAPLAPSQDVIPIIGEQKQEKKKKIIIGYIGSHVSRKATYLIIPLALLLKEAEKKYGPVFKLRVWGSGLLLPLIKRLTMLLNLNDVIIFEGTFNRKLATSVYHDIDILFLPSIKEGFSLPTLEAAIAGVPTIVFRKAKIPKEIKNLCIQVYSFDEIMQVLDDLISSPDSYEDLSSHAKEGASKFSWDITAKKTLHAYIETATELK